MLYSWPSICSSTCLFKNVGTSGGTKRHAGNISAAASGWAGWVLAHPEFGSSVNPITTRGQIMPTTLLLAHPNLKSQRHLCNMASMSGADNKLYTEFKKPKNLLRHPFFNMCKCSKLQLQSFYLFYKVCSNTNWIYYSRLTNLFIYQIESFFLYMVPI